MRNALVAIIVSGSVTVPCVAIVDAATLLPAVAWDADTASHATTGVVKAHDRRSVTITRTGPGAEVLVLALNASTHIDGTLGVGVPVSVRYRYAGQQAIATAITVQRPSRPSRRTS